MRKMWIITALLAALLCGCGAQNTKTDIAATTKPVAEFTRAITSGTGLTVECVVTDSVSCLHDYSLSVGQMKTVESADVVILSGLGLEAFMKDALASVETVDCSAGVAIRTMEDGETDPHIWLSPENAKIMVANIAIALSKKYPQYSDAFAANELTLEQKLDELTAYGNEQLSTLGSRELVTFHDGFGYFAESFHLTILAAIEEEAGSEASAADLKEIIDLVKTHAVPAVFTEVNGSTAAASVIQNETGAEIFTLDTALGESDYSNAMRNNIDSVREALG